MTVAGKFGQAAVCAVALCNGDARMDARDAWNKAVGAQFADKPPKTIHGYQVKRCPKEAFLGLCEAGQVEGIPVMPYIGKTDSLSKQYAVDALDFLRKNQQKFSSMDVESLAQSLRDKGFVKDKQYNDQMHVVAGLWTANLLKS
jgi:hypothetical protein